LTQEKFFFQRAKDRIRFMLSHPAHLIAQGFGTGLSPFMPGTLGTLISWAFYEMVAGMWPTFFTLDNWLIIISTGFFVGIWACRVTGRHLGVADHSSMVWDEIVAFWLVLLTQKNLSEQLTAFLIFRFFDIVKVRPINYFDQNFKGGFGVMGDDMLAALYTILVLSFLHSS
jgi:phosphatidylglycerophosphatase A